MRGSRRGGGQRVRITPWKITKNIGFLSNTGQKNTKLPSQHSILCPHRHDSETPFKWRFAGVPMMAREKCYLDPSYPLQSEKIVIEVGPPLTKVSGPAYEFCTIICKNDFFVFHLKSVNTVKEGYQYHLPDM